MLLPFKSLLLFKLLPRRRRRRCRRGQVVLVRPNKAHNLLPQAVVHRRRRMALLPLWLLIHRHQMIVFTAGLLCLVLFSLASCSVNLRRNSTFLFKPVSGELGRNFILICIVLIAMMVVFTEQNGLHNCFL
jgi:hypothetical protein